MTRGVLLSLFIHAVAIYALIFSFFSQPKLLATKTKSKVISLSFVKLEKPKPKVIKPKPTPPKPKHKPKIQKKKKEIKKKIKKLKPKPKKQKVYHKKITKKTKPHTPVSKPQPIPSYKTTYINLNRSKIYEAIQRAKRYPPMAKRLKKEGVVRTCFELFPNRDVKNITTSGASRLLQKGAYQTILDASVEFPNPNSKVRVCLDIAFRLDYH